jgi:hypothetical protein
MNDTELDRLLNTWEAPAPPRSLREDLRARFPRAERRRLARPLGWVLAIAVLSATLAIGMEQSGANPWDFRFTRTLNHFKHLYQGLMEVFEPRIATSIVAQIRQSDPKVYVDGQLAAPLEYGNAATMNVQVPGDGVYAIISYRMSSHRADGELTGWVEAGHIHNNVIEFQAGSKQVRIVCNQQIVSSDRPIFAMRRPSSEGQ